MAPNSVTLAVLLCFILPFAATAQSYRNVTLGSSLTTTGQNTSWLSPSGDFAFGFRPLASNQSQFLLAIWFEKTSNKTIVWYAKEVNPVQAGSTVTLTGDGLLKLEDQTGNELWSRGGQATYAAMLDSGNFILAGSGSSNVWDSFGEPTDTLLPGQVLPAGKDISLRSKLMDDDYSDGRFKLYMQKDGNLVMYPVAALTGTQYTPYYSSNTVGNGTGLVFNQSGSIYVTLNTGGSQSVTSGVGTTMNDAYHRATLDPDGVFRQYDYSKNGTSWTVVDAQPKAICSVITNTGSGACGFNSYCKPGDISQRADCQCPKYYSFIDPNRKYKGCEPDFSPQRCDSDGSDFDFEIMINVDWPLADYEQYSSMTEADCKQECLIDCFCAVAIHSNDNYCWKKKIPLSNGRMGSDVARKAFIKFSNNNISGSRPPRNFNDSIGTSRDWKDKRTWILVGSSLLGSSLFINLLLFAAIVMITYSSFGVKKKKPSLTKSMSGLSLQTFTYEELEQATDGFSEEVGRGAFGIVYKGALQANRKIFIAVKKLHKLQQEMEKEFSNEVKSIGQTYHKNLVKLLGYCNEGLERLLVYEFMSNGSLKDYLFVGVRPKWSHRIQIALDVARGLSYLHADLSTPIVHCDIKPENVLLDDNFVARISDFGMAKLLKTDQSRMSTTGIRGTRGYVAPEWFKNTRITSKADVYSFGVVLLEIICCRKNINKEAEDEDEDKMILTFWAYDCYRDQKLELLVENDDEALLDMNGFEKFVMVALWCIQDDPQLRPSMQNVEQMLEGTISVPTPPDPSGAAISIV